MPQFLLSFPILGNPHGRVLEVITDDLDPPSGAAIIAILDRYGDLFPRTGTVEIYDHSPESLSLRSYCDYTFRKPGEWALVYRIATDPRPSKNLRGLYQPD